MTVGLKRRWRCCSLLLGAAAAIPVLQNLPDANAQTANLSPDFFETKVRPVLANSCYSCHAATAMGGLRLDSRDAMVKGLPATANSACVRLPDFLSYREMAQRLVKYGNAHPSELAGTSNDLAQHTLETDFPCPPRAR